MTRLLFSLVFALVFPLTLYAAEPMIHVVIAADGRAGFGTNLVTDYKNMERLFRENIPQSRLNLILMEMDEIMPNTILQTINRIELGAEDALVFYYSGRAANDAGNGGQFFQLRSETGKAVELHRRTLLATLKGKKARLTVLLTDCCNLEQESSGESEDENMSKSVPQLPEKVTPIFEALFLKPEGTVDMTSSKRGEASFVDATGKKRGSCFTWPLVALFEKHRNNDSMIWEEFTTELAEDVKKAFLDSHPEGFKFSPPLNGIAQQMTQTIEIYGTLPGVAPVPLVEGPRFGVRAVTLHGGGVRITQVLPDGPGDRAGFEVGDVILEINGKPIHNEQDYSKAIDDSPKKISAKVINVKDGQTLNITFELGY